MNKETQIKQVKADAEAYFRNGNFYCSEAVVAAVRDTLSPEMPEGVIGTASGFPVGVGRTKCLCGAISGGVIALGYEFGRRGPSTPGDPKSVLTLDLAAELQGAFRDKNRVSCCLVHVRGMDMKSGEHKDQCVKFTGEMAEKTAEIILREREKIANENA